MLVELANRLKFIIFFEWTVALAFNPMWWTEWLWVSIEPFRCHKFHWNGTFCWCGHFDCCAFWIWIQSGATHKFIGSKFSFGRIGTHTSTLQSYNYCYCFNMIVYAPHTHLFTWIFDYNIDSWVLWNVWNWLYGDAGPATGDRNLHNFIRLLQTYNIHTTLYSTIYPITQRQPIDRNLSDYLLFIYLPVIRIQTPQQIILFVM